MRTHPLLSLLLVSTTAAAQGFGAVYTLTNDPAANEVKVALRTPGGALLPFASYATTGAGTGAGLGSQGAIAIEGDRLYAVDPGSDEVTMFRVFAGVFLWRQDTESSGGDRPTSVAAHGRFVYVLNAGSDEVRGFRRQGGDLVPLAGAVYGLSQAGAAGAQVGFSPDGRFLVVTERATDRIAVFPVGPDGRLGVPCFAPSAGPTPFGFEFRSDGALIVSEAAGGAAGASVVSSYRIQANGTLQVVTGALATTQSAACWIVIPKGGQFAYTTNTASGTLSGVDVNPAGGLNLLPQGAVAGDLGAAARPIDAAFTRNGQLLYVLDAGGDAIRAFRRLQDGSLELLPVSLALDDGAAGLLAR